MRIRASAFIEAVWTPFGGVMIFADRYGRRWAIRVATLSCPERGIMEVR